MEVRCIQVVHLIPTQGADCTIKKVPEALARGSGPVTVPTSLPPKDGRMLPPHGRLVLIAANTPASNWDIAVVTIPLARAAASAPKASGSGTFELRTMYYRIGFFVFLFSVVYHAFFLRNFFSSVIYFLNILVSRFGKLVG